MLKDFLTARATEERPLTENDFIRLIHDIKPAFSHQGEECPADAMRNIARQGRIAFPESETLSRMFSADGQGRSCESGEIHWVAAKYLEGKVFSASIIDFPAVREQAHAVVRADLDAQRQRDIAMHKHREETGYYERVNQGLAARNAEYLNQQRT